MMKGALNRRETESRKRELEEGRLKRNKIFLFFSFHYVNHLKNSVIHISKLLHNWLL